MDDSSQNQNQDDNQAGQPVNPVSTPQKEVEVAPASDYIVPSAEIESIIKDKEVKDAGVTEVSPAPSLDQSHFKAGMRHAAESTPVPKEPTGIVKLPMTQSQAQQQAKGSTTDATTWLASFILRIFKKMGINNSGS